MARLSVLILFIATLLTHPTGVQAEILVIVNVDNPTTALNSRQVVDLYMGRFQTFPGGESAFPLDLPPDSAVRVQFYRDLMDKSLAEVNAYWARLLFTGRATPPRVLADSPKVLKAVRENRGAIGYIDSADLDEGVKVVGRVD